MKKCLNYFYVCPRYFFFFKYYKNFCKNSPNGEIKKNNVTYGFCSRIISKLDFSPNIYIYIMLILYKNTNQKRVITLHLYVRRHENKECAGSCALKL